MMGRWLCLFLFVSASAWAEPQGRVRLSIDEGRYWVGQRVLVHLDLLTNGLSFSGQRFDLPQISGGVLLQTDSSTLKLSEQIEGERWQILRYDLSLFAQREGEVQIPPFDVHFGASLGYGQPETRFDLKTQALGVQLQMPPGADPSQPVVTSPKLTVSETWQPEQKVFQVGQALTRTLTIEASDVSAIALPAVPQEAIEGLDLLAKPPLVQDKSDRGSLTGFRQEQLSYLFKQAGNYTLPGGSIAWWNPEQEILETWKFEARVVEVAPDPLAGVEANSAVDPGLIKRKLVGWLAALFLLLISLVYWRWPHWRARRAARLNAEPAQFKRAIKACRRNDVSLAWTTTNEWLSTTGLAIKDKDQPAWEALQQALVLKSRDWSGHSLAESLIRVRRARQDQRHRDSIKRLKPLNPV